jgi:lysophospholipase L1-like esterase
VEKLVFVERFHMLKHLVFIGDSLTQWGDWERRFPGYQVSNLGISGETVEGLLARRERIRTQIENPDFIFLMTGINNIATDQYDIIPPYREIVRNLTTWYKQATVVVQSLLPVEFEWISNNVIKEANRRIEEISREFSAEYLDVYRLFVDAEGTPLSGYLSDDGVHLAGNGYDAWAKEVERFLKRT